jgi:hypothetical protein
MNDKPFAAELYEDPYRARLKTYIKTFKPFSEPQRAVLNPDFQ